MRDDISKLRARLADKDKESSESIRQATSELQQTSLKLFEAAYKKMSAERGGSSSSSSSDSSNQQQQQSQDSKSEERKNWTNEQNIK